MLRYFTLSEFDSPDIPGSGKLMDADFLRKLDIARSVARTPFKINSGYRSIPHNIKVGGSLNSAHLSGHAADIHCTTSSARYKILNALILAGFTRIGVAKTFIHVDDDTSKDAEVVWLY